MNVDLLSPLLVSPPNLHINLSSLMELILLSQLILVMAISKSQFSPLHGKR